MTKAAATPSESKQAQADSKATNVQSTRETIESIIVAFILAFLFRAFVAEAFVIPTGSMAPTLMGAHKDIFCEFCGQHYQASASREFDSNTGALQPIVTIASTCATCRGLNAYDLRGEPDHASFSGDRILVSKFAYVLGDPQRWDVFVFKYPTEARMNYIKRLVGLPGETLLIEGGDIYTKRQADEPWTIARKPPSKVRAMRQIVFDSNYQADLLIEQGWPSPWQPLPVPDAGESAWNVKQSQDGWFAELAESPGSHWLRYYHKFLDDAGWHRVLSGQPLGPIDPYAAQLITDYLAYNSSYHWARNKIYNADGLKPEIDEDTRAFDLAVRQGMPLDGSGRDGDGHHWVGDLMGEFQVEVLSESGTLLLDLVEFGVHFQCAIDVASGQATVEPRGEGLPQDIFSGSNRRVAQTAVRGPGAYRLEFANFDDQLILWVNGRVVEFDAPLTFDSRSFRNAEERRPYWTQDDPLDAAPVAIGGQNLSLRVDRATVYRDIYYIAIQGGFVSEYSDYDLDSRARQILAAVPDFEARGRLRSAADAIAAIYAHPEWWDQSDLFSLRGSRVFDLDDDHYFPMGDNSSHSSDARAWLGHHYVEQKFLLGKALLVFWPHTWNTPVPFTPNFARMGLIR